MRRSIQGRSLVTGFAVLAALMAGGHVGNTTAFGGITVKGGVVFNPDPQNTFYLNISIENATLPSNSSSMNPPALDLTIDGLTGLKSSDFYQESYSLIKNPPLDPALAIGTNAVTLDLYNFGPSLSFTSKVLLYQFIIQTDNNQSGPLPDGATFSYTYSIGGSTPTTSTGNVFIRGPLSVPEPGSIVLMLMGGAVLPCFAIHARRRRVLRPVA